MGAGQNWSELVKMKARKSTLQTCHHRADESSDRVIVDSGLRVQPPSGCWRPDMMTEWQSRKCPNNRYKIGLPM